MTDPADRTGWRTARRGLVAVLLLVAALTGAWWAVVRATAPGRMLAVHRPAMETATGPITAPTADADARPGREPGTEPRPGHGRARPADTVRVLAWNIAHGRGDRPQGPHQNYRAGSREERAGRMARIAGVIRAADADIVALNEVDFDAAWSHGLNQAAMLAGAAGYPARVEQRNFDFSVLFADFAFGNAVLTRLPVIDARPLPLPPRSRLERALLGAKAAAVVRLRTAAGPVAAVPVHLEFRDEATRLAAVPAIEAAADSIAPPLLLAGDFNTAPPGWPGAAERTAVGRLLGTGWRSPSATGDPADADRTFPSRDPAISIDWILAEPPLRIIDVRVLTGAPELSDHLPVLAVVEVRQGAVRDSAGGPGADTLRVGNH